MKRKILFSLLIIVVLFTITGCGKGVKTEDGKTAYKCFKKELKILKVYQEQIGNKI